MIIDERRFLSHFFAELERLSVRYAVLRGADRLPDSLNGGDVDILVPRGEVSLALTVMSSAAVRCGGRVMGQMSTPHFVQTEMMGCVDGVWWGCCIDLFDGIYVKSVLPIAEESLLACCVDNGSGVWTLPRDLGDYLGFVKELLVAGKRSPRYVEGAMRTVKSGGDDVLASVLCRDFIRRALVDDTVSASGFVRGWMIKMAVHRPFSFCKNWIGFLASRVLRYFNPCGKMIAVLGTDGSGKTTLLNEVLPVIRAMNHNATIVHHLKPDFLPPLGRLRGVKYDLGHVCKKPHASRPSGFVGSIVRLTYLTADYILGYWFKVRVKIAQTPIRFWIFDRYAYDVLIDPLRFRISLPKFVVKLFLALVPKPNLIICLGGSPEKIFNRKPETSLKEVKRQIETLKGFVMSYTCAAWVDTTLSLDESAAEMLTAMRGVR